MKKILILITAILLIVPFMSCKSDAPEIYVNSQFSEVTMRNIYGESRNVAKAIDGNLFACDDESGVSFILPDKWKEYNMDIQVQKIEGGIGTYAFADRYDLTSLDFSPYYADLFAIIYVNEDETTSLLEKYGSYFTHSKHLGYMDGKQCYLLYNKEIDLERSPMFTKDERKYWKKFLKVISVIDGYIMISA